MQIDARKRANYKKKKKIHYKKRIPFTIVHTSKYKKEDKSYVSMQKWQKEYQFRWLDLEHSNNVSGKKI